MLWSQKDRILDVAVMDGTPAEMVVLGGEQVTAYSLRNALWEKQGSASIGHHNSWPRDLRGHLVRRGGTISAYLPGVACDLGIANEVRASCRESDGAFPLASELFKTGGFFAPTRNFFTAFSREEGDAMNASPFFSAAPISGSIQSDWVVAGIDGKAHLVSGVRDQTLDGVAWGSDVAGVQSQCGTKWQVLATAAGDGGSDSVGAYEVSERNVVVVSVPLGFGGRVDALWTDWKGSSAVAVVENSQTGMYEAYRLSLVCSE
jgi:hypothetical protein